MSLWLFDSKQNKSKCIFVGAAVSNVADAVVVVVVVVVVAPCPCSVGANRLFFLQL